jgi:hypothetical protein
VVLSLGQEKTYLVKHREEKVTGGQRKADNVGLHNLYASRNVMKVINSRTR